MKKAFVVMSLIVSLGLCFFLGSQMLLHGDFYYLSDQARDFSLVRSIVADHKLTLIGSHSGLGGLFHGPLWLYLLVPFFLIGQGNPFTFAYWYVALPLITIVVGFFVGRKLYGEFYAVIVAFLLGKSSVLWQYKPNKIGINAMPILYIFFILCAVSYMRGKDKALIGVAFLTGLAFQFETASAIALIPLASIIVFLGKKRPPSLKIMLLAIVSFFISLGTFILFDLRHHYLIFLSTLQIFNKNQGHRDYINIGQLLTDHLLTLKNIYLSVFFSPGILFLLLGIIVFAYFYYVVLKQKTQKRFIKEFLFLFLTPVFVFGFYTFYPHPIYPEYVLDMTISLVFSMSMVLMTLWVRLPGKILAILFLCITGFSAVIYIFNGYSLPYAPNMTSGSYQNQKKVTDWIWADAKGKPFGYFVYTPETFTYGMDYLFWWEASTRHIAIPTSTKMTVTYIILYPPLQNDAHAHAFWIKNTLHTTASVRKQKEFPGNILVEEIDMHTDAQPADPNYYQNLIFR